MKSSIAYVKISEDTGVVQGRKFLIQYYKTFIEVPNN